MMEFGSYLRRLRQQRQRANQRYALRQVAFRVGVTPAYLSRVERGETPPPSEDLIRELAMDLGEDPDLLLAMADQLASDIHSAITERPTLFAALIRQLGRLPDDELQKVVRQFRNVEWLPAETAEAASRVEETRSSDESGAKLG